MIKVEALIDLLKKNNSNFFTGVPDSLLKSFCGYVADHSSENLHVISANEGGAVGIAIGYYLATGNVPMIYMQNSGLGNAINPLTSLADPEVYSIPMLLLIGWRGEPGIKDEPQHVKQGRITPTLLECLEIPYKILPKELTDADSVIRNMIQIANDEKRPTALLIQRDTFEKYNTYSDDLSEQNLLSREEAISLILKHGQKNDIVIGTTGMASREIYEFRKNNNDSTTDFLTVGGMGHASQIALAVSKFSKDKNVFCLDGDGALLMHLGGLATNAHEGQSNFHHIVLNNGTHDSVGGQPTLGSKVNFKNIAESVGFHTSFQASNLEEILICLNQMRESNHPSFLEIIIKPGFL